MGQNFQERAKEHAANSLAKNSPNLLEDLPVSIADIDRAKVYLEAAQVLLRERPPNITDISDMLKRAIEACHGSKEKQRSMLTSIRNIRENMITLEDIRF